MIVGVCTGGFDPIHVGHLKYLKDATAICDYLIVGVNSDWWLERKKLKAFMSLEDRMTIMKAIRYVDRVIHFNDDDGSASDALRTVRQLYPDCPIRFMNGGDRTADNIPEMHCGVSGVDYVFGVGGAEKLRSSSDILELWRKHEDIHPKQG